jgi:transcriptional regulator with XRE-family HTH domain
MASAFGTLLREFRNAADISMGELARRINYSKSQVSKIENGLATPTAMFARLCDQVLGTGGELSAFIARPSLPATGEPLAPDDEEWILALDETGGVRVNEVSRRSVLTGAGAALGLALTSPRTPVVDDVTLTVLRATFDQLRALGAMASPHVVLAPVIAHLHTLRGLAATSPEPMRAPLLLLASRVAEYTGWMSQEAGNETAALRWTERAVAYAAAGQDPHLASFAFVRRAEIALYEHDGIRTVELARQAQANAAAGPRILGLAARCEAQGHALAGDADGYERALDRAAELLATRDESTGPVLGSTTVRDEVSLARGWALYDLGRPRESAEILDGSVGEIPRVAHRARARFGVRCALAHAQNGEIDQACTVTRDVIADATRVDSATIRFDLRELSRTLSRWRTHGAVRELHPEIITALHPR